MIPIRVLIAEDDPDVRRELKTALGIADGFDVVGEAPNGLEALALQREFEPDVVLMDLQMPLMDGLEATRVLKARTATCRVVALTIHSGESERQNAFHAGVDAFVSKDASIVRILAAIRGESENERGSDGGET